MKDIINAIRKPVDAIENKFGGSWKKILIILGIVLGIFATTNILGELFYNLMKWHNTNNIDFLNLVLKKSILEPIIIFGSMFAGIYIYSTIAKKDFNLVNILTVILVTFLVYYLLQSTLNILYCFPFMRDVDFLDKIRVILTHMSEWYKVVIFILALHKLFDFKLDNKSIIGLVVLFAVMFSLQDLLSLALGNTNVAKIDVDYINGLQDLFS